MPGPMAPRPPAAAMRWVNHLDDVLEAAGYMPEAEFAALIASEIGKLETCGDISQAEAESLAAIFELADA